MTDENPAKTANAVSSDFLVRGTDYLARFPDFKLIGRDKERLDLCESLMRQKGNNAILVGQNGVGTSSIALGLQAGKEDGSVPVDIIGKRLYWLETDALFSSGDANAIKANFDKVMTTLKAAPDTVLIIEDVKEFLDGIRNNSVNNLLNILFHELETNSDLQAILLPREEDLAELYKCHSDIKSFFNLKQIQEPDRPALTAILESKIAGLEEFHGLKIAPDVVPQLVELAFKYPAVMQEVSAQPRRSISILEGALVHLRTEAHLHPQELKEKEERLAVLTNLLSGGSAGKAPPELQGKSPAELAALRDATELEIKAVNDKWDVMRKKVLSVYKAQRKDEDRLRKKNEEIAALIETEKKSHKEVVDRRIGVQSNVEFVGDMMAAGLANSPELDKLQESKAIIEAELAKNSALYKDLIKEMNKGVVLTADHILGAFSSISGQSLKNLTEDETEKLLNLKTNIKKRVFGQDEAIEEIAGYILNNGAGLKDPNKPIGSFLLLGPTGVGKTEVARALSEYLFNDERKMVRMDMASFSEKNTVTRLIGPPPGYEGYADGGQLTNEVRAKPDSVVLFDEVEKGHKDVYNVLLPVIDDGRLRDGRGRMADFTNTVILMTTNLAAEHYDTPGLTREELLARIKNDLMNPNKSDPDKFYFKREFLGRLSGILLFNNLDGPTVELIAGKQLKKLTSNLAAQGIIPTIDPAGLKDMCKNHFDKQLGGRSINNYIDGSVKTAISQKILENRRKPGKLTISYNTEAKKPEITYTLNEPANANRIVTATARPA